MLRPIFPLLLSYFLGSIPFGFLITYLVKKVDIRKVGSGNIGATNVRRILGKKWGILVFSLDFFKGFFSLFLVGAFVPKPANSLFILAAVCAVCGHNWPVFLKFKGGKGVATSLGAIGALSLIFPRVWIVFVLSVGIWMGVFFISRYVSLASLFSGLAFFIFSLAFSLPGELKILSFVLFAFMVMRHRQNIKDLFARKEHRF